jgi:hypothetical protein
MKFEPSLLQEVVVLVEVHPLRLVGARLARSHPVVEVVPEVRPGEVDGSLLGAVTDHREVPRVPPRHDEGTPSLRPELRSIVDHGPSPSGFGCTNRARSTTED